MDPRRMCPHCRAFITDRDKVCPYCNEPVGPRYAERARTADIIGGFIPQARFNTMLILLINAGLFVATEIYCVKLGVGGGFGDIDGRVLYAFGAKIGLQNLDGQWWRLVTAGFLHGGLLHILMNSWVLFDLGAQVEAAYGTARMIVFYFVSTFTGFLLSAWWSIGLSIGASAGLMGLIGAMIAYSMTEKTAMATAMRSQYVRWLVYIMLFGFIIPGIDNAAHVGGLAGGFAIAFVFPTPRARLAWQEPVIKFLAGVAVAIT